MKGFKNANLIKILYKVIILLQFNQEFCLLQYKSSQY